MGQEMTRKLWDYPRARGGTSQPNRGRMVGRPLSPRTRGNL
ncbi:Hypothetical protein GbCGDNIH3_7084 [Granulibacter bethesdensis]|uniref:Uncharacterized protein n=1 Tax=Granulibacter bethesdensis TaxID=364410 RepID=A0AAN0REC7_9PROT|nr:Hypothetical protein GbCGDNIH3_7084 [Granulibacter bethesdensis]